MLNPNRPYFGNAVGRLLVLLYSGTFQHYYTFNKLGGLPARVYKSKRLFPWWMRIIGQTHGEYIFIHVDYWNTSKGIQSLPHEYVHVWQSRSHGWWGLWFMAQYVWYLIRYGYENNPFEVEARKLSSY
jgi:hypothetical protein